MVTAAEQVMPMTKAATQSGRVPTTEKPPEEKETPERERTRVTTARSLQASERQKRNDGTMRTSVVSNYLNTGAPSAKVMREAQQADPGCKQLYDLLTTGSDDRTVDDAHTLKDMMILRREAARAEVHDGLLCRRVPPTPMDQDEEGQQHLRLYVPVSMRESMLLAYPDHLGHVGTSRMAA